AHSSDQLAARRDLGLRAEQRALALEGVQAREGGRAGERAAGEGVAVEEGPPVLRRAEEALIDPLRRERGGKREVPAGEPLPEAEEVRADALLLTGEHRAG